MKALFDTEFDFREIQPRSRIMDYLSDAEGGRDEDPLKIADVPLIANLVNPTKGAVLFREPSRAVDVDLLEARAREVPLEVFDRKVRTGAKRATRKRRRSAP